ncbi:MAG: hypothetical protein KKF85_04790 [Gammaproteobacteria bacterium]|nr:hypothetical protein [Gammaproteobacteria bacterium]MBU3990722.1 hypothetical protein [Gammaproteobacteria bacterium]MBU4004910.1 hypothetical protein [Gammaproteobacteria bacterium]MBU4020503.1 hypothetical protein [Gammaproteobacteria bacterium]MBU4095579.1 hypothetical protein [Gammaproteobacteria bacterium]
MKSHDTSCKSAARRLLAAILGTTTLFMPVPSQAASVVLATAPLASSTSISVKPNLVFVLDDSGSMAWDHMPDDDSDGGSAVSFKYGHYGVRSSQCNQVFYDPAITYIPPIKADGVTSYSNSSFSGAWLNGFNTGAGTTDLRTNFKADQDGLTTADTAQTAYYFSYSGSQTTPLQKNYHSTTSTFYNECNSANKSTIGEAVFTKIVVTDAAASTTAKLTLECSSCTSTSVSSIKIDGVELMSAPSTANISTTTAATNIAARITLNGFSASASTNVVTITGLPVAASSIVVTKASGNMSFSPTIFQKADAAKKTNFANWYSYYRTRMLMMKTATGHAFKTLDNKYRVGLMKISSSTPVVEIGTFEGSADTEQRGKWYKSLYDMTTSGSTPLRLALSNAGRYYAGKLTGTTDPIQYSCQQNFTILSTDGYWNAGDPVNINGTAFDPNDNQDATAPRPMYDGGVPTGSTTVNLIYTRNSYSCGGCGSNTNELRTQPQIGSCSITVTGTPTGSESCTPPSWSNNGSRIDSGNCLSNSACTASIPVPNPSTKVEISRGANADSTGGSKTVNSLADIAMYYYQTDLRSSALGNCTGTIAGENVCTNNVFTSSSDNNLQQHMTTFTLGMGASGRMNYASCYLADNCAGNEDYTAVKLGSKANSAASPPICSWQANGTDCNWPIPGMSGSDGLISNIDDLWHAAVNGRGAYFAATNPTSLSAGLSNALAGLNARRGAAAAAATSTLNPVQGNNYAYVASYTTVSWKGNLEARGINTETGVVSENASWCVENVAAGTCSTPGSIVPETDGDVTVSYCVTPNSTICPNGILDGNNCKVQMATACAGTMSSKVSDTSDTRNIYTSNGTARTPFDSTYATAQPTYFSESYLNTRSPKLSQWDTLTATQKTAASGANLVNYLRGRYEYEDRSSNAVDKRIFRYREAVLGDALESQPAYLGPPVFSYPYPGYDTFRTSNANRAGTVYMGANDGMLHAFDSNSGVERWAYVPSMVIPNLWKLADKNYAILHTNYVNGSPITTDFFDGSSWRTILVAGLNGGGRGYYALDITDPSNPTLLWELTASGSGTSGAKVVVDDDMGYGFGQAVITRKVDGTWVVLVTSGYNNTGPGDGKGYLYVLNPATGAILSKISTGVGTSASPSGLAKITGWNDEPAGNQVGYVYGGDLEGNVWRFDVNAGTAMKFAELKNGSGNPQPITTTPTLGKTPDNKRIVFIGTGKYLETGDLTTIQTQSFYAIKDDNATATLTGRSELVQQPLAPGASGAPTRTGGTSTTNVFLTQRGWYVDFPDSGERVNIDSKLVQGTLLVATTVPSNTACSPGGYGWLNFFDYLTGSAVNPTLSTVVSSRYESPIVGITVFYIDGKPIASVVTATNPTPTKDTNVEFKPSAPIFTGKRVTWRELIP